MVVTQNFKVVTRNFKVVTWYYAHDGLEFLVGVST